MFTFCGGLFILAGNLESCGSIPGQWFNPWSEVQSIVKPLGRRHSCCWQLMWNRQLNIDSFEYIYILLLSWKKNHSSRKHGIQKHHLKYENVLQILGLICIFIGDFNWMIKHLMQIKKVWNINWNKKVIGCYETGVAYWCCVLLWNDWIREFEWCCVCKASIDNRLAYRYGIS